MKVYHLAIIETAEDVNEYNRTGGETPRFQMHRDISFGSIGGADRWMPAVKAAWIEGAYKQVCELRNDLSLDDAFHVTQNIEKSWDPAGIHRSTSVGDVIEKDGELFAVASFGFEKLEGISAS